MPYTCLSPCRRGKDSHNRLRQSRGEMHIPQKFCPKAGKNFCGLPPDSRFRPCSDAPCGEGSQTGDGNTGGNNGRSPQNVKTAAPETQQMMGLKTSTEGDTSWQFVELTRSSCRSPGKRSGSPLHPQRGRSANLQVATSESWRDKQTGEMRSRRNGIAWCCSASSRRWLVISA